MARRKRAPVKCDDARMTATETLAKAPAPVTRRGYSGHAPSAHAALAPAGLVAGDRHHRVRLLALHAGPQRDPRAGVDRHAARPQHPAPAGRPAPELGAVGQPLRGRQRVARADHELLLRDAALHRHAGGHGLAVRAPLAPVPRRAHRAGHHDAARAARLLPLPHRAAPAVAAVRLHRHGPEVPHVGLAGRPAHRQALQPVRRDAEPAHRVGALVRHRDLHAAPAACGCASSA